MAKRNRTERRIWWANVVCLSLMLVLAITLATRFVSCGGCGACFTANLINKILLYTLTILVAGYLVSIPVMAYKVWQSRKSKADKNNDCDEGSCSY